MLLGACYRGLGALEGMGMTDKDFWRLGEVRFRLADDAPALREVRCSTCSALCRHDPPYWMCDVCKRVVGWDIRV